MISFKKEEEVIKRLTENLDKLKYIQNCFVDMSDSGAIISKIENGLLIKVKLPISTIDYKLLSEYHSSVSNIYSNITECIDKVKLNFDPCVNISSSEKSIYIRVELHGKKKEETEKIYFNIENPYNLELNYTDDMYDFF